MTLSSWGRTGVSAVCPSPVVSRCRPLGRHRRAQLGEGIIKRLFEPLERICVATLVRMRLLCALSERSSQIFGRDLSRSISPDAEDLEGVVDIGTHRRRTRSESLSGHRGKCSSSDVGGKLGKRAASGVARCPSVACGVGVVEKTLVPLLPGHLASRCRARFAVSRHRVHNQPRASVAECSAGFVAETLASKLQTVDAKDGRVLSGVRG